MDIYYTFTYLAYEDSWPILKQKSWPTGKDRRARKKKSRMSSWCKVELEKDIRMRRRHKRIGRNRRKSEMKSKGMFF